MTKSKVEVELKKDIELYPRTHDEFSLDEICYVMDKLRMHVTVEDIAYSIKRSPFLVRFKFLELRSTNPDGSLNFNSSVPDEKDPMLASVNEQQESLLRREYKAERLKEMGRKKYQEWEEAQKMIEELYDAS